MKCCGKLYLLEHLYDDMSTLISQAEMTNKEAKNNEDDVMSFTKEFLEYYNEEGTRDFIFWKVSDELVFKKYSRPKHLHWLVSATIPNYKMVYQLWFGNEIIYIGKTDSFHKRLVAHSKDKTFDSVKIALCKSTYDQDCVENKLIDLFRPKLNLSLNLEFARKDCLLPDFTDSRYFMLDVVSPCNHPLAIPVNNHIFVTNGNYLNRDRFKNTPYWWEDK